MTSAHDELTSPAGLRKMARQMKRQASGYRVSSRNCALSASEFYHSARQYDLRAAAAARPGELPMPNLPAHYEAGAAACIRTADAWLRRTFHLDQLAAEYDDIAASYARRADRMERDGELVLF